MSSQNKYELYYFKHAGLATTIRTILEIVNADYTIKGVEDWASEKANTPFGQVPVLYVIRSNGMRYEIAESQAISRYLGREHGLVGNTNEENALVDMVMDSLFELLIGLLKYYVLENEEDEKDACKNAVLEDSKKLLPFHEKLIKKHGGNGHYLQSKLTLADIHLFTMLIGLQEFLGKEAYSAVVSEDKTPELVKVFETVKKEKGVQRLFEENYYHF
ncbi:uncharacterized protein VTP21DRAFT_11340 [Calcarisporiella thermophila]|uniref:uncharacterized protein n=1 Tax=Calcarisporiella thermophila TaxID=911321 RepID=UPI00374241E9